MEIVEGSQEVVVQHLARGLPVPALYVYRRLWHWAVLDARQWVL